MKKAGKEITRDWVEQKRAALFDAKASTERSKILEELIDKCDHSGIAALAVGEYIFFRERDSNVWNSAQEYFQAALKKGEFLAAVFLQAMQDPKGECQGGPIEKAAKSKRFADLVAILKEDAYARIGFLHLAVDFGLTYYAPRLCRELMIVAGAGDHIRINAYDVASKYFDRRNDKSPKAQIEENRAIAAGFRDASSRKAQAAIRHIDLMRHSAAKAPNPLPGGSTVGLLGLPLNPSQALGGKVGINPFASKYPSLMVRDWLADTSPLAFQFHEPLSPTSWSDSWRRTSDASSIPPPDAVENTPLSPYRDCKLSDRHRHYAFSSAADFVAFATRIFEHCRSLIPGADNALAQRVLAAYLHNLMDVQHAVASAMADATIANLKYGGEELLATSYQRLLKNGGASRFVLYHNARTDFSGHGAYSSSITEYLEFVGMRCVKARDRTFSSQHAGGREGGGNYYAGLKSANKNAERDVGFYYLEAVAGDVRVHVYWCYTASNFEKSERKRKPSVKSEEEFLLSDLEKKENYGIYAPTQPSLGAELSKPYNPVRFGGFVSERERFMRPAVFEGENLPLLSDTYAPKSAW